CALPICPAQLKQRSEDGTPIGRFGTARSNAVRLSGIVDTGAPNECTNETWLEVELVDARSRFTYRPTHSASIKATSPEMKRRLEVFIEGLPWGTGFRWQARQRWEDRTYRCVDGVCTCPIKEVHESAWSAHTSNPLFSFRTPVPRQDVVEWPSGVATTTGTVLGGDVASLAADDGDEYRVLAAGAAVTTIWEATFSDVTPRSRNLEGRLRSRSNLVCTQTIHVWNVPSGAWSELASGAIPTVESEMTFSLAGGLGNYVEDGELRLRVACAKGSPPNFVLGADLLEIAYERATIQ
ncbi:MAG: hypothetical protein ACQGVC_25475, partial [Myxococcota bacterium]